MIEQQKVTMGLKIDINAESDQLSLRVNNFNIAQTERIRDRLTESKVFLEEILAFDDAVFNMPATDRARLQPGLAALDSKYNSIMQAAAQQVSTAKKVVEGNVPFSDHGFFEFDDV